MKIMVVNSGSSSIKYQVFDMRHREVLASGLLEQIGEPVSRLKYKWRSADGAMEEGLQEVPVASHRVGLQLIMDITVQTGVIRDLTDLSGIGHRVLHGGEAFWKPTLINERVIEVIREMIPLGPLHNPPNLMGIEVARQICPGLPQVAVFDTDFGKTMPPHAYHYALPYQFYKELRVRRYGFHGTSHRYVSKQAARFLGRPLERCNLITLHLGNGASTTAIRDGKCVDTSMGLTPLEGLVMGTRSGDLDPAIPFYLARSLGKGFDEIEKILNKESGLKGICGVNDMREVERLAGSGNLKARLAIDMFCYRIKKYIGSYYAVLGRVDAIIFTGGIGENAAGIRAQTCEGLEGLGIVIDGTRNKAASRAEREISAGGSRVKVLVIPTNEELEIAEQTAECLKSKEAKGRA